VKPLYGCQHDQDLEARLLILTREVNHRAGNLLAVIQGMIRLTEAEDVESFKRILEGRIDAIHTAHQLLSENAWEEVSFWDIMTREFAPYLGVDSDRIRLSGHDAKLNPKRAQNCTMIIHELVTNSLKYGALSNNVGTIDIHWSIEDGNPTVRWKESGGPEIKHPPIREGSGSRMVKALLKTLNAKFEVSWEPDGVRYYYVEYPRLSIVESQLVDCYG
jgi:two-component sensor histidine kinase